MHFYKIGYLIFFAIICAVCGQETTEKDFINVLNDLDNEKSLYLFSGITVDRIHTVDGSRSFGPSTSPYETFMDRTERYLSTHELNFSFDQIDAENVATGRALNENRSKKIKKMLVPLLLALKVKMAIVLKVLLMIVKFISLKALTVGVLALLFSGASFFKDLLAKKKDHVTTAYITGSPLNAEIVHSDGWNRNGQATAQDLAYNYHAMAQPAY